MSFLSHPDWLTGLYLLSVKEKDKKWGHGLALKVLLWFKIELVYSIWKPVIWKYNFSNFFKCSKSSQNVKFDSYSKKGNPHFTFNVIHLVLLWLESQVFCLSLQWGVVFFYFLIIVRHKERERLSQYCVSKLPRTLQCGLKI